MFRIIILVLLLIISIPTQSFAVWVWTPDTNKWVNPKWAVRDTPAEQLSFSLQFYDKQAYKEAIRELKRGTFKNVAERAGRAQDAEDGGGLETLRRGGYM